MKYRNIFWAAMAAVFAITAGCGSDSAGKGDEDPEPPVEAPVLKLSVLRDTVEPEGGEVVVEVTSNREYKAEIGSEWITLKDREDDTFIFDVAANGVEEERSGSVVFSIVAGELQERLTIVQKAKLPDPVIDLDTCELTSYSAKISSAGGNIEFTTRTNRPFTVESNDSWLSVVEDGRTVENYTVVVSAAANNVTKSRTGSVDVSFEDTDEAVTLTFDIEQEARSMTATDISGVWTSGGKTWFFYRNGNVYAEKDGEATKAEWSYSADKNKFELDGAEYVPVYDFDSGELVLSSDSGDLVFEKTDSDLPDESKFIREKKTTTDRVNDMSHETWRPDGIGMVEEMTFTYSSEVSLGDYAPVTVTVAIADMEEYLGVDNLLSAVQSGVVAFANLSSALKIASSFQLPEGFAYGSWYRSAGSTGSGTSLVNYYAGTNDFASYEVGINTERVTEAVQYTAAVRFSVHDEFGDEKRVIVVINIDVR